MNVPKVIVCTGSGGVGKTTLSCALAANEASQGKKVLVLTIDPARRLATALGLSSGNTKDVLVPEQKFDGELYASMIEAEKEFRDFVIESFDSQSKATELLNNNLFKQLSTSLNGSQEFTSLLALQRAYVSEKYDVIILDTPPSQHALDFFESPKKLYGLFNGSLIDWFIRPVEEQGFFRKVLNKGTQTVLKTLEKVTGSQFMNELAHFFESIREIKDKVAEVSQVSERILQDSKTRFNLVTTHGATKLEEAKAYINRMQNTQYQVDEVYINKAFPMALGDFAGLEESEFSSEFISLMQDIQNYREQKLNMYKDFQVHLNVQIATILLPEYSREVVGLSEIDRLGQFIQKHSMEI